MFLKKLMPDTGLYCVALLLPKYGTFRHIFHDSIETAAQQLGHLSNAGHNVYLAQATFKPEVIRSAEEHNKTAAKGDRRKLRSQDNALFLKNFFLDIDCGEKWPLKNQKEGCKALAEFVAETGLPMPTVVNSGNGLYAHWVLQSAIPSSQWRTVAKVLKQVVATYSPAIGGDTSRTSDSASVLRPPGTINRKPGRPEKSVCIIHEAPEVDFLSFVKILGRAAKKKKVDVTKLAAPKPVEDINADFLIRQESIPSDPAKVADRCAQLGAMRQCRGDVTEPLWYCCLGLLAFCEGGDTAAQEWSSGHSDYAFGKTESKMQQWLDSGVGPTTCSKFGEVNPNGCLGCPNNGQIKSPIVLGRPDPEQVVLADDECPPPTGFRRAEDGLYVEVDGRWVKFYDQDLWLHQLAWDESLLYEVMVIRHRLPHEGELECTLRSSLVNDPKALLTALADNHVKVVGKVQKNMMVAYMESYQQVLQRHRRMNMLLCQMGWKEDRNGRGAMFVLGKRIFYKDGQVEEANLAKNVPRAALGFKSNGDIKSWVEMTKVFRMPHMEPLAFAFLAGGFGSVLLKYTGFDGAMVSMFGGSGCGKTLILRMINSVWGYHKDLIMLKDDTRNTILSRLGVYANLPMTLDEVTNMTGADVSDFAYRITQGRDKGRLNANAVEKTNLNSWNTIAVTSSNASLIDLLSTAKADPSAEINRILEYEVHPNKLFADEVTTKVFWCIDENYGLAGDIYAQWLVQNADKIKPALDEVRKRIEIAGELKSDERFWGAVASTAIVGGLFAKRLGLIDFDVAPLFQWVASTIKGMRKAKVDTTTDAISLLAQFFAENAHNRLVISRPMGKTWQILDEPRGMLAVRVDAQEKVAYISRTYIKNWIGKRMASYGQVRTQLINRGVLLDANCSKNLGQGSIYVGATQPCWKVNLLADALAGANQEILMSLRIISGEETVW